MTTVDEFAPAKVNLTLHVTGQRADGYHLLDSLVVFADVGDRVAAAPAEALTLRVTGPRAAGVPTDRNNLVLRAAALFGSRGAALTLSKSLPASSGIGGGSADAAATVRALARMHGVGMPCFADILRLGADVPVCLECRPTRMEGIGDLLAPVPSLPRLPAVLVNPGVAISTPDAFKALRCKENPAMPVIPEGLRTVQDLAGWLAGQRNDLEPPGCALAPEVPEALEALRAHPDCLLARMSGSGATCFGLFPTDTSARNAAGAIARDRPDWWVVPTILA